MKRIILLGIFILVGLVAWGTRYYFVPLEKEVSNTNLEKAGIYAEKVYLKGRSEGNLSWEVSADNLNIDLNYKHFVFEGDVKGKVYRDKKLSLLIITKRAEIDRDKNILKIPTELHFETEDGFKGIAPEGIWYFDAGIFMSTKGRVKFEKVGEFKAEADMFVFDTNKGKAEFEGNVVIETYY
ncbi:MAG: hypothetical protein ACP5J9_07545 [Dictyoglomus sp.]